MCSVKYFTFKPVHISQAVANILQVKLTEAKIWNQKLTQSGTYQGIKIGVTSRNFDQVKGLIRYSKGLIESSKSLKQDTLPVTLTDKQQLAILFPDAE